MIGDEEGLRISAHAHLSFLGINPNHHRFAILVKASKKLSCHLEARRAVGGDFLDLGECQREPAHRVKSDCLVLTSALTWSSHEKTANDDVVQHPSTITDHLESFREEMQKRSVTPG